MPVDLYDIIILRGAPGSGKSTLAKSLRKYFREGVTVEVDTIRGMINSVKWTDKKEHITALNATIALCQEFLKEGYRPVLVVDTLGYSRMKKFLPMLDRLSINGKKVNCITLSLYCEDNVLNHRINNRDNGFKDFDASRKINNEMKKPMSSPEAIIDTSRLSPNDVFKVVIDELDRN
jgi:adenylate kinase family enzyme